MLSGKPDEHAAISGFFSHETIAAACVEVPETTTIINPMDPAGLAYAERIALAGGVRSAFRDLDGPTIQDITVEALHDLGQEINRINRANGWNVCTPGDWDNPERSYKIPAVLALIHSEVSEALEAFRRDDKANFMEEMADVFIRILDCVAGLGLALDTGRGGFGEAIFEKLERNKTRGYRHGGKRV